VDISEESIASDYASITVNKEMQRVRKDALNAPKTQSSVRKVFLPSTVARMLVDFKLEQDYAKDDLGDEYFDYNLVICSSCGTPRESSVIQERFTRLINQHDLPKVVFHSLRHSSITYKLKLNGGDIKAVQGDSGHSQTSMVTDVYSHILDDDRRINAQLFEDTFYTGKGKDPDTVSAASESGKQEPSDMETLARLLGDPKTADLLKQLVAAMDK
jgi:integrase